MAIHWKIPFKTLHSDTLLTVNVYDSDYSGEAVSLKGAAQPFETQEDDSDDMFIPVRKQTGYLRIVDDGFAADGVTAFNWRDFIPTTDTDRPVTLTDASNNVLWQGFMQAQNFGAELFGNPQNREFPVQCSLSVTQGIDIDFEQTKMRNFAYLLWKILDIIPTPCKPQTVVIQGDAETILTRLIDWQNFVDLDTDNVPEAKYKMFDCLEEMCKFWGLMARTHGRTLYLIAPDDQGDPDLVTFSYVDIVTLAAGLSVTPTYGGYSTVGITGDFANRDNKDYQMRGVSDATFNPSPNTADINVIEVFDHELEVEMDEAGWVYNIRYGEEDYDLMGKTNDILTVQRLGWTASALENYTSFNRICKFNTDPNRESYYEDPFNVIMFKEAYQAGVVQLTMQTKYMHSYSSGFFRMLGDTYIDVNEFKEGRFFAGNRNMFMRMGIGETRATAKWWDGHAWVDSEVMFRATLGNNKPEIFSRYQTGSGFDLENIDVSIINTGSALYGYIFIDFLGSDFFPTNHFNIKDFRMEFCKNCRYVKQQFPNSGWNKLTKKEIKEPKYTSHNANAIEEDFSVDSIFASENVSEPGYGIVLNPDGSYFTTMSYGEPIAVIEHPEKHLVKRVTNYWSSSKRKIEASLLSHNDTAATAASAVTPGHLVTIDGTTLHPVAISKKWRDEEINMVMMEVVTGAIVYGITCNFENVTSNAPSSVEPGDSLSVVLTGVNGNKVQENSVIVTMGGNDITSTAYNHATKTVSIASVTGNVSITAVGRPYDAEVEYLATDGTAYINLQTTLVSSKDVIDFDCMLTQSSSSTSGIFGNRTDASSYNFSVLVSSVSAIVVDINNGNYATYRINSGQSAVGKLCTVHMARSNKSVKYDGDVIVSSTTTSQSFTTKGDARLFNWGTTGPLIRFYTFQWKRDGNFLFNLIPVRNNGVGYMYDKVSGQLFGNANSSGTFTYGNDV